MPTIFLPPTRNDMPAILPETHGVQRRLFRYYGGNPRGLSVVFASGHYVTVDNPSADQLVGTEGIHWFLGGHVYLVDDDIAILLTADGYTLTPTHLWSELTSTAWSDLGIRLWGGA